MRVGVVIGIRSILIGVAACALLGCGSAPQADTRQTAEPEPFVTIDPTVNVCPTFSGALIIPLDIAPAIPAQIIVKATDPDGDDNALMFHWFAPSGQFSDATSAVTNYRCGELGPQALEITAEDSHGCRRELEIDVTCVAH